MFFTLVIITDLYIISITILELEANSPLVINSNGVLPFSFRGKRMKAISWWYFQIIELCGHVYIFKFPDCSSRNIRWEFSCFPGYIKITSTMV